MTKTEFQTLLLSDIGIQKMINENMSGWDSFVKYCDQYIEMAKKDIVRAVDNLEISDTSENRKALLEARCMSKALSVIKEIPTDLRGIVLNWKEALEQNGEEIFQPEGAETLAN